jgi:hypothetical protein
MRTISKIPGFIRTSWQAFSARCSDTSKSLAGSEYTKSLGGRTAKSRRLRSEDRAGQLTGPPRPIHCPQEVWLRYSDKAEKKSCCTVIRESHVLSFMHRHIFR